MILADPPQKKKNRLEMIEDMKINHCFLKNDFLFSIIFYK